MINIYHRSYSDKKEPVLSCQTMEEAKEWINEELKDNTVVCPLAQLTEAAKNSTRLDWFVAVDEETGGTTAKYESDVFFVGAQYMVQECYHKGDDRPVAWFDDLDKARKYVAEHTKGLEKTTEYDYYPYNDSDYLYYAIVMTDDVEEEIEFSDDYAVDEVGRPYREDDE